MATYESFIKLNGAIGDLVFYNLNGKNIVRKKSGFNKTAYKKSPSYEKVRQNSSEFGHCSKVGKLIRSTINKYIEVAEDALLYQRFAKTMTNIKDLDKENEKGKRTVKSGLKSKEGKTLLQSFEFGNFTNYEHKSHIYLGLWDKSLQLDKSIEADKIIIITIKIDFDNYLTESFEEKIVLSADQNDIFFENHFSEENEVLHFVVAQKNDTILKMGFV